MDAIETLAAERLIEMGADVQVQLEKGTGTRPVLWMLLQARARAATAMGLIVDVDPVDAESIRKIQGEIALYSDLVGLCQRMLERGREADAKLKEDDREAMDQIIQGMSPEERRLYNFEPKRIDA